MWSNIDDLRTLSHALMWASGILAVCAAFATAGRYYVDQRVGQLNAAAQAARLEIKEQEQAKREEVLRTELEQTRRELRDAAATSERELSASKTKVAELEALAKPRTISPEQRSRLVKGLSSCEVGAVSFTTPLGDAEALRFSKSLEAVFKDAGWTVQGGSQAVFTGVPVGLILQVPSKESFHVCAPAVQRALAAAGFEAPGEVTPGIALDVLHIVVGAKP